MDNQISSSSHVSLLANDSEGRMPLRFHVQQAVEQYFIELEGETATNLYQTILQEVEKPLLEVVLEQTQGNQSKTALILGLNRGTLRKKMQQYGLM
ncbi:DNA-binding transcriptional regulator Fis [Psychrobacter phenylpyruvicus]|uniref:Putative Fis-like DNA-binding protein n=1 Tax=Psychrobacter phenylpyruvicus TaxID=29432 RepID=A0A379LKL2_9GAMM|nr:DNA-binding transcriptional regulator Fis [Psychrobacter phenylpyruvicus]SUD90437.1 Hin recombinational enhancer-binding protein [Psychrobacter phenylpyruvicus]